MRLALLLNGHSEVELFLSIFATPSLILHASGSVGVAICMWLCGAVIAAIGTTVYIELGSVCCISNFHNMLTSSAGSP